jgi:hypothetical protein
MSLVLLLCCCRIFQSSSTARVHGDYVFFAVFMLLQGFTHVDRKLLLHMAMLGASAP